MLHSGTNLYHELQRIVMARSDATKEQRRLWDLIVGWLGGRDTALEQLPTDLAGAEATFSAIVNIANRRFKVVER